MTAHQELASLAEQLDDWEIRPLVFLAHRLTEGKRKYGDVRRDRDWRREMAEEAADFVNYYVWSEGR